MEFDAHFRSQFARLCRWRRDVRRFARAPVPPEMIDEALIAAHAAPSVGNSQPWRWMRVESEAARTAVKENFRRANRSAARRYQGDRAELYSRLKLEGLDDAPVQFAVFCAHDTEQGFGLGRQTMPETLDYSVVASITTFWLAARALGLGVGWVSILDPNEARSVLAAPPEWKLIAYLCVGWPLEACDTPELERAGWQAREELGGKILAR